MKLAEPWQAADARATAPPLRAVALAALAELVPPDATNEPVVVLLLQARAALQAPGWPAALRGLRTGTLHAARGDEALLQLVAGLGLHDVELLAAATALAAQLDPAAARAIAWLQGTGFDSPGAAALPTLGLLAAAGAALLEPGEPPDTALLQLLHGTAARAGLWVAGPAEVPSQRSVRLPALLLPWLHAGPPPLLEAAPLAPSQWQVLQAALAPLQAGRAVLLRCASEEDAQACAGRLAQTLGRPLLPISAGAWPEGAALLARAGAVLPVLQAGATPHNPHHPPDHPPDIAVPLLVLAGNEGAISLPGRRLVELCVPLPTVAERAAHWAQLGWPEPQALALRSRCGLAQVQHLHEAAQLRAATRGEPAATNGDLLHAQANAAAAAFEGLGQLIRTAQAPQLVLTAANRQALQQLLARCRVRERLHDRAQHSARAAVCALFSGPSGTGKTLAASWLAAQLQLPLVAIDLAALTSKWIGETEKNLAQVFSRAEGLGVVLLFDEADALFGARTDTHSSNDRFANQQTNYLLSRLERFDGIAVLTSNARQRLDGAFARRIDALVEFRQPGVEERRALWALHLGAAVPTPWLDRLASLVELPGGHVRAAALYAQALALDAGRALTPEDLLAGLQAEHAKLDRSVAPELLRPWR